MLRSLIRSISHVRCFSSTRRYTPEHVWIERDEVTGLTRVGITRYAKDQMGDIAYIDGSTGKKDAGSSVATLESTKAAEDVVTPCEINVTTVNSHPTLNQAASESDLWVVSGESPSLIEEGTMSHDEYHSRNPESY